MGKEDERGGFSSETEATQYEQAQRGCLKSLDELMERNEGLVHLVVEHQWLFSLPYEEALQAGRRGLWQAIRGYDTARGVAFSTYAYPAIMHYVWSAVKSERMRKKREVPLEILVRYFYKTGNDPAWLKDQQEIGESLLGLVERLPKRLWEVITAYYGLNGKDPQSLRTLGKRLGLSKERVRQLRNEGLVWLRQPGNSQELRSLLARHNQHQYEIADQAAQLWLKQRGGRYGQ